MRFAMLVLVLVLVSGSSASAQGMSPEQAIARYGSASFASPGLCQQGTYTQVYVPQQQYYSEPCQQYYRPRPRRPSRLAIGLGVAIGLLAAGRNDYYGGYGYSRGGTYFPAQVETRRYTGAVSAPADRVGGYTTNVGMPTYTAPVHGIGSSGGYQTNVGLTTYSVQGRRGLGEP